MPKKEVAIEVLQQLVEIKQVEQVSWKTLPERYSELVEGDSIDWRTLQTLVLGVIGAAVLPMHVSKRLREQVESAFEEANAMTLAMHVMSGRYQEWSQLHARHLQSLTVTDEDSKDPEVQALIAKRLSGEELARYDNLGRDIIGFFFQGITAMQRSQSSLENLAMRTFGMEVAVGAAAGAAVGAVAAVTPGTQELIREVAARSEEMMTSLIQRNKADEVGHFRALPEDAHGDDDYEIEDSDTR